jgi:hypothetical protein
MLFVNDWFILTIVRDEQERIGPKLIIVVTTTPVTLRLKTTIPLVVHVELIARLLQRLEIA